MLRDQVAQLLGRQSPGVRLPPVLIQGETGTGKGLLAGAIHRASQRAARPFVEVDCAAIPETLFEAELFGFERGAFTDARRTKPGLFQTASGGTVFLDEVGLLPQTLQAKMLKVVEQGGVRRLGSTRTEVVDPWVIAATNADLSVALREGRFREDLYHRLAAVTLLMPPLRDRGADILRLAEHFLARACAEYRLAPKMLAPEARAALSAYSWPGNVRELANVLERVILLSGDAAVITPDLLGLPAQPAPWREGRAGAERSQLRSSVESFERVQLRAALHRTGWNISLAASQLGVPRNTLRYRIARLGLHPDDPPAPDDREGKPSVKSRQTPGNGSAAALSSPPWQPSRVVFLHASVSAVEESSRMSRILDVILERVRNFGGQVEEMNGLDVLAAFGIEPTEDPPERAALAALSVLKVGERLAAEGLARPSVRLAVHECAVQVRRNGGAAEIQEDGRRRALAVCSALLGRAGPDSIVVSDEVAAALRWRFELRAAGSNGGEAGPAYQMLGRLQAGGGLAEEPRAPFIGREHELGILEALLAQADLGRAQAVGIMGEAGVGKSRLLREFRRRLDGRRVAYQEGHCAPHRQAGHHPVLDMLCQAYGIGEDDPPPEISRKVRRGLEQLGMDADEWAPHLLTLWDMPEGRVRPDVPGPAELRARVFEALRRAAVERSRKELLVLAIEDLHWTDKAAEDWLRYLTDAFPGCRILLLTTYRPEYRPPWIGRSYVSQLALQPLSRRQSVALVRSILQPGPASERHVQGILETAEGNPLFLRELAQAAVEEEAPASGPAPRLTARLEDLLQARMGRLSAPARQLLQTASVVGQHVPARLVERLWEKPRGLAPLLAELKRAELLCEHPVGNEPGYRFAHPLHHQVLYESLPAGERQRLHAAVGRALETLHVRSIEDACEPLAAHYSRSADSMKAVEYLAAFARKAARSGALTEAAGALTQAMSHAERLSSGPERDRLLVDLAIRASGPLATRGRLDEAKDHLLRHQERVERLKDPWLAAHYFLALARVCDRLGGRALATAWTGRAYEDAMRCGDPLTVGKATLELSSGCFWEGRFREGIEHARIAATLFEQAGRPWRAGQALWFLGSHSIACGDFEEALTAEAQAAAIARAAGDQRLESFAAWATGWALALRGEHEDAVAACQRAVRLAPDPPAAALAQAWLGLAHLEQGDGARAASLLSGAHKGLSHFKLPRAHLLASVWLAEALLVLGRPGRSLELAKEAHTLSDMVGFRLASAGARRALGRIARASGNLEEAEHAFDEARRAFEAIGAEHELARTLSDLATISRPPGTPATARPPLATAPGRTRRRGAAPPRGKGRRRA